jgi:hypothetical protein
MDESQEARQGENQLAAAIEIEGQEQGEVFEERSPKDRRRETAFIYSVAEHLSRREGIIASMRRDRRGNLVFACACVCVRVRVCTGGRLRRVPVSGSRISKLGSRITV